MTVIQASSRELQASSLKPLTQSPEPKVPNLNHRHSSSLLAGILGTTQASNVHPKILDICHANSRMTILQNPEPRTQNPEPRTQNPEPRTQNPEPNVLSSNYRHSSSLLAGILGSAQASNVHPKILDICHANSRMTMLQNPEPRTQNPEPNVLSSNYRHSSSLLAGI